MSKPQNNEDIGMGMPIQMNAQPMQMQQMQMQMQPQMMPMPQQQQQMIQVTGPNGEAMLVPASQIVQMAPQSTSVQQPMQAQAVLTPLNQAQPMQQQPMVMQPQPVAMQQMQPMQPVQMVQPMQPIQPIQQQQPVSPVQQPQVVTQPIQPVQSIAVQQNVEEQKDEPAFQPVMLDWNDFNRGIATGMQLSTEGFTGEIDQNGLRQGKGKQTWPSGQTYDGEWKDDRRHGYGEQIDGTGDNCEIYQGEWANDFRHGKGKLTRPGGETITGTWENGFLNGPAKIEKDGQTTETGFIQGGMVPISNEHPMKQDQIIPEMILCLAFWICFILTFTYSQWMSIFTLVFYLPLVCFALQSKMEKVVGNSLMKGYDPIAAVKMIKLAKPTFTVIIQNYHYVTVRTKNGTRRRRVNTHRASHKFQYSQWVDNGNPIEYFKGIDNMGLVRVKLVEDVQFSVGVAARYCQTKSEFISNNIRDVHHDVHENIEIEGLNDNKDFVFLDAKNKRPCFMNYYMNVILGLIGFSWIPRLVFNKRSYKVDVKISKLIID